MNARIVTWTRKPSALRYMLKGFLPSPGWRARRAFPDLRMVWQGYHVTADAMETLRANAANASAELEQALHLLAPHVTGFRLVMAMLTHPSWPLPVWGALQVRNRLMLHQGLRTGEAYELALGVAGWRVLEKGLEVDLCSQLLQRDACAWEGVVTIYYRGRFGEAAAHGDARGAPATPPVLEASAAPAARWRSDGSRRWHFGALTGDYNGIHQSDWYARRFGFRGAFAHPQRIVAQCLGHLPPQGAAPRALDLWMKGPVRYGSEVSLRHAPAAAASGSDFALWVGDDARPALLGAYRLQATPP